MISRRTRGRQGQWAPCSCLLSRLPRQAWCADVSSSWPVTFLSRPVLSCGRHETLGRREMAQHNHQPQLPGVGRGARGETTRDPKSKCTCLPLGGLAIQSQEASEEKTSQIPSRSTLSTDSAFGSAHVQAIFAFHADLDTAVSPRVRSLAAFAKPSPIHSLLKPPLFSHCQSALGVHLHAGPGRRAKH